MKSEKLYEVIGQIDDNIIAAANTLIKRKIKQSWVKWTAVAACFAVICFSAVLFTQKPNTPILPLLTVGEDVGSYGFEGYMAYDISELANGNPWSTSITLDTLPVYKSSAALTVDEMSAKLVETANALGINIGEVIITPTAEEIAKIRAKDETALLPANEAQASGDGATINVNMAGVISIFFDNPVVLPQEYSFTYHNTKYEQAVDSTNYLLNKYKAFLQFQSPALDIFGAYNIHTERLFQYAAYENSGSITERILSYAFNRVIFSPNDDGELWIIRRYNTDISEKIGDYPIIEIEKARELLLNGKYATSAPYEMPGAEYIKNVELIYRNGGGEQYFMPYYRFYVELPEMVRDNGLKTYGAYYVPAVEEQYISNMPLWDGSFN